mmetsp:Transcript_18302/g.23570  ORF Transcript_18302/g.23570 Transcript_18302/m.23570 type:complete len:415 (+) Transcript_18302:86-1330(+)
MHSSKGSMCRISTTKQMRIFFLLFIQAATSFEFHVAPMQGYTAAPLRSFYRLLSSHARLWTEMEKVEDLLSCSSDGLERRFSDANPNQNCDRLVLQLGGNNPDLIRKCVDRLKAEGHHFGEFNLNCGCPSTQAGGASTFGASMMKDPALTARCVHALKHSAPDNAVISVKTRIAVFDNPDDLYLDNNFSEKQYQQLHNYISQCSDAGASHIILHARPVILQGLSPVKNRQVPSLHYSICDRVARDFENLTITLNGGLSCHEDLEQVSTDYGNQIKSYMAGRWMIRRPLDIVQVNSSGNQGLTKERGAQAIQDYANYIEGKLGTDCVPLLELSLPLYLAIEQLREEEEALEQGLASVYDYEELDELYDHCSNAITSLGVTTKRSSSTNFKKLASGFKTIVGKKVHGKWKRNRAEL